MAEENKKVEFKWVRSKESIPEVYGNFFHATWTLVDVRVRVGELVPDLSNPSDKKAFLVDERAAVTVSWPQAKVLAGTLTKLVASYEQVNGEIKQFDFNCRPRRKSARYTKPRNEITKVNPPFVAGWLPLRLANNVTADDLGWGGIPREGGGAVKIG